MTIEIYNNHDDAPPKPALHQTSDTITPHIPKTSSHHSIESWIGRIEAPETVQPCLKRKHSGTPLAEPTTPLRNQEAIVSAATSDTDDNMGPGPAKQPCLTPQSSTNAPATTSPSITDTKAKVNKDAGWVKRRMQLHGLFQDQNALSRFPDFEKKVKDILNIERHSAMKPLSAKKFSTERDYFDRANEDTVIHNLIPLIIKPSRSTQSTVDAEKMKTIDVAMTVATGYARELLEDGKWAPKDFWDDGVITTINDEFTRTFLPDKYTAGGIDSELAKAMMKDDSMTNPKPDFCYGLNVDKFPLTVNPGVVVDTWVSAFLEVAPEMYHPMLIVEGKSNKGDAGDAKNQACRGGATLVNAARLLRSHVSMNDGTAEMDDDTSIADDRTFVYSAVVTPQVMQIYAHWAEVKRKNCVMEVLFHMSFLTSKALGDSEQVADLRKMLHNILEWGCITRSLELETLHKCIQEDQQERWDRMVAESPSKSNKRQRQSE